MKLAEALQERADLNRKIEQLRARLSANALVQEGEKTVESPDALLAELNAAIDRLEYIITAINLTNSAVRVEGRTLTELIASKDCLSLRLSACRDLANAASQTWQRARGAEIPIRPAVDVAALRNQADDLARRLRETDNLLQRINWTTELIGH